MDAKGTSDLPNSMKLELAPLETHVSHGNHMVKERDLCICVLPNIKRQNKNMKHTYELTKKLGESYGIQLEAYAMQDAHANEFRVMNEEYPRKLFFMGKY